MDYFLLDIVPDCILSISNQKVRINYHIIMDQEQGRKLGRQQVRTVLLRLSGVENQSVLLNSQFFMDGYTNHKSLFLWSASKELKLLLPTAKNFLNIIFNFCILLPWTDKKKSTVVYKHAFNCARLEELGLVEILIFKCLYRVVLKSINMNQKWPPEGKEEWKRKKVLQTLFSLV